MMIIKFLLTGLFALALGLSNAQFRNYGVDEASKLDSIQWSQFGLDSLELYNHHFEYTIFDTLHIEGLELVVIERSYIEVQYQWMCMFNEEGQLIDFLVTQYANSDGGFAISAQIEAESDIIVLEKWNAYSDITDSSESYRISTTGFIKL